MMKEEGVGWRNVLCKSGACLCLQLFSALFYNQRPNYKLITWANIEEYCIATGSLHFFFLIVLCVTQCISFLLFFFYFLSVLFCIADFFSSFFMFFFCSLATIPFCIASSKYSFLLVCIFYLMYTVLYCLYIKIPALAPGFCVRAFLPRLGTHSVMMTTPMPVGKSALY